MTCCARCGEPINEKDTQYHLGEDRVCHDCFDSVVFPYKKRGKQ
jgi:recombinational DNA repair protein (RecF pathway)